MAKAWWTRVEDSPDDPAARGRGRFLLVLAAVVAIVMSILSATEPLRLAEARAFDFLSTIRPPAVPEDAPVIIAIDEPSMAEIGRQWPWPRDLHARLVAELRAAGTRAIGIDIIFAEPSNPASDAALASRLGPDVVLAGDETLVETPHADQIIRVEPLTEFVETDAATGIATISLDSDGVVRRLPRREDGFARTLLSLVNGNSAPVPAGALMQSFGPARTLPTISYYQALEPDVFLPPDFLDGKVVIVGLSMQAAADLKTGGADAYATSHTLRSQRLVSGAEIQATAYVNLAKRLLVTPAPRQAAIMAIAVSTLLSALTVRAGSNRRTIVHVVIAAIAFSAGSWLLMTYGQIYLGPIAPLLSFMSVAGALGARDYAVESRIRRGITHAFSQYLSPVLVQRLATHPALLKLGGERRTITVLFTDIRGFTTISERLKQDPERLTLLVNRMMNPLSRAVLDAGGTIDKYIGDSVMAFWNAPLDDPEHARHAVEAAFAMLDALEFLNRQLADEARAANEEPIEFAIGIGINTGDCVVGNMGSDIRFNYSALGDAVNLAARLESETKTYRTPILIGPRTAEIVGDAFIINEVDRVAVKGKMEVLPIFAVMRPGLIEPIKG